jgi:hypothetical protein
MLISCVDGVLNSRRSLISSSISSSLSSFFLLIGAFFSSAALARASLIALAADATNSLFFYSLA